ncbi:VOC family protein [Croceicoccus bisphenolivorans]|uniref:VOC family protein n=1 Tax=Croceicoccus bisphenolivorans TaxID=1783232 RepID=UPI00082F5153|nr:VOC family protein [Croceicoccus bisphenolivorans]
MTRKIFINLPVTDLPRSKAFYTALGFVNEPKFTDDTAAAMQWSDHIVIMLLTHDKWRQFTDRPFAAEGASSLRLCINLPSRGEVEEMNRKASANNGMADADPPTDYGFMMSRAFADPDGHIWEPMWMDEAEFERMQQAESEA